MSEFSARVRWPELVRVMPLLTAQLAPDAMSSLAVLPRVNVLIVDTTAGTASGSAGIAMFAWSRVRDSDSICTPFTWTLAESIISMIGMLKLPPAAMVMLPEPEMVQDAESRLIWSFDDPVVSPPRCNSPLMVMFDPRDNCPPPKSDPSSSSVPSMVNWYAVSGSVGSPI